jgi:hypothetical protein
MSISTKPPKPVEVSSPTNASSYHFAARFARSQLAALPKLVARIPLVRSRAALAVLDNPGVTLYILEGNALLGVEDK